MSELSELLDYCDTDLQRQYIEALIQHGSQRKAANAIGVSKAAVQNAVNRVRRRAAKKGWSPGDDSKGLAPDGYKISGKSILRDRHGDVVLTWTKTAEDRERQIEIMREAVNALKEDLPRYKPSLPPIHTASNLLSQYTITDYHLGMLSWGEETGEDWDTDIAEQLLVDWFSAAIKSAPDSDIGVFAQLGDFLHWDGLEAVTPTSNHILDADTRFQRLVRVAIRVLRRVIDMLLHKHSHVHVIMAEGNHDIASSVWIRELLATVYTDEPRVSIDNSADIYYCYEFGQVSLFYHHGHKRKPDQLDTVLASKFRDVFGRTKHSYAHVGHLHHDKMLETNLMHVEQHRTLAAKDAHASRGGWLSGRDAKIITYHKEYGCVSQITISPEMVWHGSTPIGATS